MTKDTVCVTPGCWIRIKPYERYCLACRLDLGIESDTRRGRGRPTGTFERGDGYSSHCVTRHHGQCSGCLCDCGHQKRSRSAA
jgi:hypothetical protein